MPHSREALEPLLDRGEEACCGRAVEYPVVEGDGQGRCGRCGQLADAKDGHEDSLVALDVEGEADVDRLVDQDRIVGEAGVQKRMLAQQACGGVDEGVAGPDGHAGLVAEAREGSLESGDIDVEGD